jgi:hypothetical protein
LPVHGHLVKEDACAEIHASKVRSTVADRQALAAIVESAQFRGSGGRVF